MAWCFSTRASVATLLTTHPCVSRCSRVKLCLWFNLSLLGIDIYFFFHDCIKIIAQCCKITYSAWIESQAITNYLIHPLGYGTIFPEIRILLGYKSFTESNSFRFQHIECNGCARGNADQLGVNTYYGGALWGLTLESYSVYKQINQHFTMFFLIMRHIALVVITRTTTVVPKLEVKLLCLIGIPMDGTW